MSIVIMVGQLLLGLSILVILHELGHFLAARAFGIKVEKFYLFFDAWNIKLLKFNYKGVEYGIGWLPLGGYVKIAGMIDESMDTEQLAGPPQPWEFRSKPAWQRLIVMLGGIIVNVILGIIIFWMLTAKFGQAYTPNSELKYGIVPGPIGEKIGIRPGDKVVAINGHQVKRFEELLSPKVLIDNTVLTVQRGNETVKIPVPGTILNDISDSGPESFIMEPRFKFTIDSVVANSAAKKAGLAKGDSIIAVNNTPVVFYDQLQAALKGNPGKQIALTLKRHNNVIQTKAQLNAQGQLGLYPKPDLPEERRMMYSFFGSLPIGATQAWTTFSVNAKALGKVFTGQLKAQKAFTGPIGIASKFGGHIDWVNFWGLVGLLSMALALMNILPIPALDGGHALFLIIEIIKGKPLSDKFLERAQIVGFVVLLTLMVFIFGNDIFKIIHKH